MIWRLSAVLIVGLVAGCGVADDTGDAGRVRPGKPSTASTEQTVRVTVPAPRPTTTESTTTEADPAPSIRDYDFKNHTYLLSCGEETVARTLVDGEWTDPRGPTFGAVDDLEIKFFGDVSGDGDEDVVVAIGCSVGAGTVIPHVMVMTGTATDAKQVGQTIYGFTPRRADKGLTVDNPNYGPEDPRCCPSSYLRSHYVFRDYGLWHEQSSTEIPLEE